MGTVQRSFWSRNPWALPLILALIILAVIAGVLFARQKKTAASATATPTATPRVVKVVVTPTATPKIAVTVVVTPTPPPGKSTPLPHATPQPTVPGLTLGEITHKAVDVARIQAGANARNPAYTYYLNPIKVVQRNLPRYGFKTGFKIVSPPRASPTPTPFAGAGGRPVVKTVVLYQGRYYTVFVAQPGVRGPHGIWLIVTILSGTH